MHVQWRIGSGSTHQLTSIVSPCLTLHHRAMDFGEHGAIVRNIALKLGNDGAGFHNVVMYVGNGSICPSLRRRRFSGCTRCKD